jgi:translation initiation factor 1
MTSLDNILFPNSNDLIPRFEKKEKETNDEKVIQGIVHIRNQQRNGRKSITTIQGLAIDLDQKKITRFMRKEFATNGTVLEDDEYGEVIQLQGDVRKRVADYLVVHKICEKGVIKIHGI